MKALGNSYKFTIVCQILIDILLLKHDSLMLGGCFSCSSPLKIYAKTYFWIGIVLYHKVRYAVPLKSASLLLYYLLTVVFFIVSQKQG